MNAVGIGCTIQTSAFGLVGRASKLTFCKALVVAQNAVEKQSRAVVTGLRNYSRFVAGAVALALCGTIRNLVLRDQIDRFSSQLPSDQVETLLRTGRLPEGSAVGDALRRELARANMTAFRAVFWTFVPLALLSVVFTIFIPVRAPFLGVKAS